MNSIRYGLQKISSKKRKFDIVNDPEFKDADIVFLDMCANIKKEEKEIVQHKEPSETAHVFQCRNCRKIIQDNVFVDNMWYICNRGREDLRDLGISDFSTGNDDESRRFIYMCRNHVTKNHRDNDIPSQGMENILTERLKTVPL